MAQVQRAGGWSALDVESEGAPLSGSGQQQPAKHENMFTKERIVMGVGACGWLFFFISLARSRPSAARAPPPASRLITLHAFRARPPCTPSVRDPRGGGPACTAL